MSENREEILADFQACTGIEDVAEAIYVLEETNWDLLRAVNKIMPQDTQSFQANAGPDVEMVPDVPASPTDNVIDLVNVANNIAVIQVRNMPTLIENNLTQSNSQPSTSASHLNGSRIIRFNVHYCDRVLAVDVPDTGTVVNIKNALHTMLKVTPCRQVLSGWARMEQYQNTPFSELSLPDVNPLQLTLITGINSEEENEVTERLRGNYILKIGHENADKTYTLNYPGTKTILDVKSDIYSLTSIHVRNQIWNGWPPNIDDQTMLALSGINYPEHELILKKQPQANIASTSHHTRERKTNSDGVIQIDSDEDEFEDASESFNVEDDYFVDNVASKRIEPLIPRNIDDEVIGSISFSEQFTNRYGPIHPNFYQGTLDDAIKEACNKPAKDRKLLGIYLHHDASVLSNVFCTQLLGFESVMQMMESNFVLWGWDLTFEANRTRLQASVLNTLGPTAAQSLKNIPVDRLPAIIIIMKIRSSTEIFNVVYGNVGVNELLSSLIEATEVFTEHQRIEVKEEADRAEREMVKWEQDMAFNESLEADRLKEETRRALAEAERSERMRVEQETAEAEATREAVRRSVESGLPTEPSADTTENMTKIRFRLPNGEYLERRFLATTILKVLLDFCIVKGYPQDEYKVISSWPRRDLTALDSSKTMQELNLCPQETVILEER